VLLRNTGPFNVAGIPTISVPCGFDADGLPIGLSLAGRPWEDDLVLRVAHAFSAGDGLAQPPSADCLTCGLPSAGQKPFRFSRLVRSRSRRQVLVLDGQSRLVTVGCWFTRRKAIERSSRG